MFFRTHWCWNSQSEKECKWLILNDIANSLNRKEPSLFHCLPKDTQHSLKDLHSCKLCTEHNHWDFFILSFPLNNNSVNIAKTQFSNWMIQMFFKWSPFNYQIIKFMADCRIMLQKTSEISPESNMFNGFLTQKALFLKH